MLGLIDPLVYLISALLGVRHLPSRKQTGSGEGKRRLWVPRMSSTSRDQAIFMDESANPNRALEP